MFHPTGRQTALRDKVALHVPTAQITNLPTSVALYAEGEPRATYTVMSTPVAGAGGTYHVVSGIVTDDVDESRNYRANVIGGTSPTYARTFAAGRYARSGAGEAAWVPYSASPAFNKNIGLAAASGSGVGSHTNRKIVTPASTHVHKSDWSALTLVADSSAVGGVSATVGHIAFAEAYSDFRGRLTRSSATTYPPELRTQTCYTKTDDSDASDTAQGVPRQRCAGTWLFEAQAGDQVAIEWLAHLQSNTQADVVNTNSTIKVRLMN